MLQPIGIFRPCAAGQLIAYELPLVLATLGVVIQAGSMNMQDIVVAQNAGSMFGWDGLGNPYVLTQFVGFFVFMAAVQAELTQPPFDMPIAESELVSGYMTEYSGFRFLIFFIAEFATVGVFSLIAAVLFLGGWGVPFAWFGWDSLGDVDDWMNIGGPLILALREVGRRHDHLRARPGGDLAGFVHRAQRRIRSVRADDDGRVAAHSIPPSVSCNAIRDTNRWLLTRGAFHDTQW